MMRNLLRRVVQTEALASLRARGPMTRPRSIGSAVWVVWALGSSGLVASPVLAQSISTDGGARRAPALDAAMGVPPVGARVDPSTRGDPGFADQARTRAPDQTYRSNAAANGEGGEGGVPIGGYVEQEGMFTGDGTDAQFHTVEKGDTLWSISGTHLGDPYLWPKLWSYNDHITNAHWVFPGDRIRLYDPYGRSDDASSGDATGDGSDFGFTRSKIPVKQNNESYMLNQYAYVDAEQYDLAMKVVGGGDAKVMMSTLDTVYLSYDRSNPPIPGERLVVYTPQSEVFDVGGKKRIGYVVHVLGEVEVEKVARKAAEANVAFAFNPIERGHRVGPLRRKFRRIERVPAKTSAAGVVVATVSSSSYAKELAARRKHSEARGDVRYQLAGEEHFVVVNLGQEDGLQVGNVLEVVRKGDEYTKKRVFHLPYEDGWPRRIIGEVLVVEVQAKSSLGVVVESGRELERGDHVELRGPGFDELDGGSSGSRGPATPSRASGGRGGARVGVHLGH